MIENGCINFVDIRDTQFVYKGDQKISGGLLRQGLGFGGRDERTD